MKQLLYLFVIIFCIGSCWQSNEHRTVEGDLYFKIIDFQRFFDAPDSILVKLETAVAKANTDTMNAREKRMYGLMEYMIKENLLRKPFIRIRLDNGEVKILFLDSVDYIKFNQYNWNNLGQEHKKVRIKAEVSILKYDTLTEFNTIKLLSVEKVDGKTYWTK